MYASNHFEQVIINLMRGSSFITPGTLYVGLFLSDPRDSGTEGTEVDYTGYARQAITFNLNGNTAIRNSAAITFPTVPTAISSPVTHIGIYDSATGTSSPTNMWLYGALATNLVLQANVSPVFRVGSIQWTMSGNISTMYKQQILNTLRGNQSSLSAFTPYLGLCNGDPNGSGTEFSGNNYERAQITFSAPSTDSDSSSASVTSNSADVFTPNAASGYWGTLNYGGIYTASSGGNLFASIPLSQSCSMTEGSVAGFNAGELTFSVN